MSDPAGPKTAFNIAFPPIAIVRGSPPLIAAGRAEIEKGHHEPKVTPDGKAKFGFFIPQPAPPASADQRVMDFSPARSSRAFPPRIPPQGCDVVRE